MGKRIVGVTPAALAAMSNYDWPGNVRGIENCVERAVIVARGSTIDVRDLSGDIFERDGRHDKLSRRRPNDLDAELARIEKSFILDALRETKGVQSRAARSPASRAQPVAPGQEARHLHHQARERRGTRDMSGRAKSTRERGAALPLGYSMLPRGQIATLVTYLEMTQRPAAREEGPRRRHHSISRTNSHATRCSILPLIGRSSGVSEKIGFGAHAS